METEKSPLYIPVGLKDEAEIFPGFGKAEMFKALGVVLLFVIADVLVFVFTRSIEAVIVALILGVVVGVGLFVKDNTNNSIADKMADMLRFSRSRKHYPYIQKDEWSDKR